jgi:hypothetical protein
MTDTRGMIETKTPNRIGLYVLTVAVMLLIAAVLNGLLPVDSDCMNRLAETFGNCAAR